MFIQPIVQADAAGAAFSADPVTGDPSTSVVNAVRGLGDRLVSGLASPDDRLVRGTQATCRSAPEGAVNAKVAVEVAQLAGRVAAHQETPQGIEWALVVSELVLLQARPITALPEQSIEPGPVQVEVPPGYGNARPSAPRSRGHQ